MDEFALIRRYFESLTPAAFGVELGVGDDCALLAPPLGQQLAITSDTLIAGRHFPLETAAADIGWKALAVNLSDLAAMGAEPYAFTLALSLPEANADWLAGFAAGLGELARAAGIALVGGDTTRGPLSITITALGTVQPGAALLRSGARSGELVCVTGTLGDAALALRQLQAGAPVDAALRARLDRPTPRHAAGTALRGVASAAIDLSDGLLGDLGHILSASGVGATLEIGQLPMSRAFAALAAPDERASLQLAGGDDYELCFCVPAAQLDAARAACAAVPVTVIGQIETEPGLRLRGAAGAIVSSSATAYRHF